MLARIHNGIAVDHKCFTLKCIGTRKGIEGHGVRSMCSCIAWFFNRVFSLWYGANVGDILHTGIVRTVSVTRISPSPQIAIVS